MKKYRLRLKQFGGNNVLDKIDKIYVETVNDELFASLKKDLIDKGVKEDIIVSKKAYLPSDIPQILALVNSIEENEKKHYDGLFVRSKFTIENGDEFVEYLDNTTKLFNNVEIAEFYNYMDVLNHARKKKYHTIMYLKDNCQLTPHFTQNLNTLYEKTEKDSDIIFLGIKNNKEKFDTIEDYVCRPNKKFVEEGKQYWANNVTSVIFRKEAIKILSEELKTMDGQFWFEIAKRLIDGKLNAYYNCSNLINTKHIEAPVQPSLIIKETPKEKVEISDRERDSIRDSIRDGIKDGFSDIKTTISDSVSSLITTIKDGFDSLKK